MRRVHDAARPRRVTALQPVSRLAWALCLMLGSCNFESAGEEQVEQNTCRLQEDCGPDAECRLGRCMARATASPLSIALEVTPRRPPSANEPLPFLFERVINKPIDEDFELPATLMMSAVLREGVAVLPASITFTPTAAIPGVSVKAVTASTSPSSVRQEFDYTVQLFEGVEYRMLVRPSDPHLPPFRRTFVAARDVDLSLDYADLPKDERTFAVSDGPTDAVIILSALDRVTGEPVSSTAQLNAGKAKLSFAPDAEHFRLDIRVSAGALANRPEGSTCDSGSPAYPSFSMTDDQLGIDPSGVARIRLPATPKRISYEGTIGLCSDAGVEPRVVGNLPISLRSTVLDPAVLPAPDAKPATPVPAPTYNATTNATYDVDAGQFRFCVDIVPGMYDIVVTPPTSMRCALFAQNRLIRPPIDETRASGVELPLPDAKFVVGSLQTIDASPLKGATIDAIALGRAAASEGDSGDQRVTRYNRSQQTTSDGQGAFKLPVDFGSYDIVLKPPTGSGFPWQIRYDVQIDDSTAADAMPSRISMVSPVALEGTLRSRTAAEDARLDGATVEAYALVPDGADGKRAISIGKATANADRRFLLLLPPNTQLHWTESSGAD